MRRAASRLKIPCMSPVVQRTPESGAYGDGELYAALLDAAPDAILVLDDEHRIQFVNERATILFGYESAELAGRPASDLVPDSEIEVLGRVCRIGPAFGLTARRKNGEEIPVDVTLSPVHTSRGRFITAIVRDATEQRAFVEQLRHLADHDPLTGVLNRARFQHDLEQQVQQSRRYGGGALLMVDVDRFKQINDSLGHAAGDCILRHVAAVLRSRVRVTDLIGRYGGDEFLVALARAQAEEARTVAGDLVGAMHAWQPVVDGRPIPCTLSIGVAPIDGADAEEVISAADRALYAAKREGRDRIAIAA